MKNSSLDKLRGLLAVKVHYLLFLVAVVGSLLAASSDTFAKPREGIEPSATATATTATFMAIRPYSDGKPIYPLDRDSKHLRIGDALDFIVNGSVETGKYAGNNLVTTTDNKNLSLTFPTNDPKTAAVILDLEPASMSFVGSRDCQKNAQSAVFECTAKVSSKKNAPSILNWFAYTNFSKDVVFDPPSGRLPPGKSVKVKVSVPSNVCSSPSTDPLFYFQGFKNTHTITWACNLTSPSTT